MPPFPPLLSIIVPTHNRSAYAVDCIRSVLAFDNKDIELVVTDTSSDGRLSARLTSDESSLLADPRLNYVKIDTPSNLTINHNDAVALARGRYICVIGDDDCITSAAIDAARWAAALDVAVVSQTVTAIYAWPDFKSILARGGHAGRLYVPRYPGRARWRDAKQDLQTALRRGFQGTDEMPRCYHGIVRRDLMESIRAASGAYFQGSSPDMSGAVGLSCLIDRYCEVDIPLTISGISGGSNSGRSAMNVHKGSLSSETQTSSFDQHGWIKGVPKMFAVETVWAHAGLSTLEKLQSELVPQFNYARLLALCALRHPEFATEIEIAIAEATAFLPHGRKKTIAREKRHQRLVRIAYLARRALRPTAANGRKFFSGLETVADASRCYENYKESWQSDFAMIVAELS